MRTHLALVVSLVVLLTLKRTEGGIKFSLISWILFFIKKKEPWIP